MADPLWIDAFGGAPAYNASELRQAMALALAYDGRLLGARSGVRPGGNQLLVSLASTTITVQPGVACVDVGLSTPQGPYWVAIPAAETHTLAAADATNPRKDIVVLRVYDNDEDSSGLRLARTEYITGTAAASPARPATPTGAVRIATIDVPASGGGSAAATDERPYTVAAGGIVPVRADADIAAGVAGRYRDRGDTGMLERDTGSAWQPVGPYRAVQTLAAAASAVTFTGIPSTLKTLTVSWTARSTDAGYTARTINLRVNNVNTAGQYRTQAVQSSGNTAPSSAASGGTETSANVGLTASAASTAGIWASGEVRFQGWNNPHTGCLGFLWTSMHPATAGTAINSKWFNNGGGAYLGNGPYTRLDFLPELAQWAAGTQFVVLGWE